MQQTQQKIDKTSLFDSQDLPRFNLKSNSYRSSLMNWYGAHVFED